MINDETNMKIKYLEKEKKLGFINDYNKFLDKCYKLFKIKENEKKNIQISVLDEEGDELTIDNENDFKETQIIDEEKNIITYILKQKVKNESNKKENDEIEEKNSKKNEDNQSNEDKIEKFNNNNNNNNNNKKDFEDNKIDNEEKNINLSELKNNENINNINLIIEQFKEENKKFQNEILEKINNIIESMKQNNEENKIINTNMGKELKKNVKKSISEIKSYLLTMDEGMKKNNEDLRSVINETKIQNNNNDDKKLEEILNKINLLEGSIKNLGKKFDDKIKEDLRNQNKIQSKIQKEEFYGCLFEDGNYILQYYYDDLIKLNTYKINIKLLNNGNLSWPQNAILNIYSDDDFFEKKEIINENYEIQPKNKISHNLEIPLNKIKNENYEIKINMNLEFLDKSKFIQQNDFNLKFIIKQSKNEINNNSNINNIPIKKSSTQIIQI